MTGRPDETVAGATGLEPAASGVTGRRFGRVFNPRFDSAGAKSRPKPLRFDSYASKVETVKRRISGCPGAP